MVQATGSGVGGRGGQKRALLIGIDVYQQPHVPNLRGCVNDVEAMRRLLVERFGFSPAHVRVLLNEQATRANILDAFERLIAEVQPGDHVFVQYSGHGSQLLDTSGDEIEGRDETIVPHDSRDPEGKVFDITDDELYVIVERLLERTPNVVLLFDCCNSGTITRGLGIVRAIPADTRPRPPDFRRTRAATGTRGPSGWLPLRRDYVLISGCRAEELSNEHLVKLPGGREARFGALTYHLVQTLLRVPSTATWADVMDEVAPQVTALYPTQHPQLEGDTQRMIFGGVRRAVDPGFQVTAVEGQQVTFNGGMAHGVNNGMLVALYPPRTWRFADAEPLASGVVERVEPVQAVARVNAAVPVGARVQLVTPAVPQLALPVVMEGRALILRRALNQMAAEGWLRLVPPDTVPEAILLREEEGRVHLENVAGQRLAEPVLLAEMNLLRQKLIHMARFRALLRLQNANPASHLNRRVRLRVGLPGPSGIFRPLPRNAGGESTVPLGERVLIEVENGADRPVYVTLLVLSADWSVAPLFPPPGGADNLLAAGRVFQLGGRGELKAAPPLGPTTVLLIATEQPGDFTSLWMPGLRAVGPTNPLERYLTAAATRGLEYAAEPPSADWTVQRVTFHVVETA